MRRYCSYLIRCWWMEGDELTPPRVERFMVERVAGQPQRRAFETFEDLVVFLRATLLESEPEQHDSPTNDIN